MVSFLVAELALRFAGVSYPLPYVPDPNCGSRLRPGLVADFSKEGFARVSITSDGRRDQERPLKKPPNSFRIAVLGDSYAEALQVPREETFWSVLETNLQSCTRLRDRSVEVLNFGVSGFGTAQELEMLRNYVWQYDPDLVLLAFLTGNDVSENSKRLAPNDARPYYVLKNDGLELDLSFRTHPYYLDALTPFSRWKVTWINRSRTLQVMRQVWAEWRQRPSQRKRGDEIGLDPIYREPETDEWQEAWIITEKILLKLRDEVHSHGAELQVVTLSNGIQVHPDPAVRGKLQQQLNVADLFYPDRRIETICQQSQIPVLILAPQLQAHAARHREYLHGFANTALGTGHWNSKGHEVAGKMIAESICNRLETP